MKQPIITVLSVTLVLAGCVSRQSENALASYQAACAAGNRDACTAAAIQAQSNQRELSNSTAVATGVGAALLGAAVVGSVIAVESDHGRYGREYRHEPDYRRHDDR